MKNAGWQPVKLDELGLVARGKSRHRPRNDPRLYGGPYPFIQTADIMAADPYITGYSQTLSEFGLAQSKLWPADTLCITIAGANTARTAILKLSACFPDSVIGFRPDPTVADIHFVKYSLDLMKDSFLAVTRGATQDNLSLDKLLSFPLLVPPVKTQRRIAGVLSAYDDLVAVNTRRIAILEEMARRLFEEWFIKCRFPGHHSCSAIETDVASAPAHWRKASLGDVLELRYGKALKSDHRVPGEYPVYGSSGVVGTHNMALVEGPGIIVGRKGNVGAIHWSPTAFFPIDTVFYVTSSWPMTFIVQLLRSQTFLNSDAAVPGLNRDQALRTKVVLPPLDLVERYDLLSNPFLALSTRLAQANKILRSARDLLLPKLMSGDVDIERIARGVQSMAERAAAE